MKSAFVVKAALAAGVALGAMGLVAPGSASAQNIYETPQARHLGVPDFSRGQQYYGGERRYKRKKYRKARRKARRAHRRVNRRAHRRAHRFDYSPRRHGKRYRNRRRGYSHFHNGFWYAAPLWLYGAGYAYDYAPEYSYGSDYERHVEWCHNRYRSYNERRDAFKGYDGYWHKCISPFS